MQGYISELIKLKVNPDFRVEAHQSGNNSFSRCHELVCDCGIS